MGKTIFKILKIIYKQLLDIVYPMEEKCIICEIEGFIGICDCCKTEIKRCYMEDKKSISYGFYGGVLKKLILELKYNKNFTAAEILSNLILEIINNQNIKADVICYVPMTKKAIKKRGFNQCEVISKSISYTTGIPISNCIIKSKNTKEQKTLSKDERKSNIQGAFNIKRNYDIKNKHVILIDDVITTGATLDECKKILLKYGANEITVLTIAKSNI
ncbi:ComF family protein [Clostridium sp. 1001271B_151109_B4]|uniref:ComF family protein n=1 Tax=Clostridium sp. 1001271B_151109_B4 TaxID=2787148 RepID=UPI0018AB2D82|nr:ComF family protein [Clostridium sp. 1001271B_151109_B4]